MKKVSSAPRRCRLCASEDILNNFNDIFDEKSELKLEMKIRKLLPVMVMSWDPMPHLVCHNCTDKLNTFNEFYETSLNAERFLRTLHGETHPSPRLPPKQKRAPKKGAKVPNRLVKISLGQRKYVYTCSRCCKTFTEETAARVHPCPGVEDAAGELETDKKCLPPLKIRLFTMRSGLYVCCLCSKRFEDRGDLGEHLKAHYMNKEEETGRTKFNKEGGWEEECCREGVEGRQTSAPNRANNSRKRRNKKGFCSLKRRRVGRGRMLEFQKESDMQEEKICPTPTTSTKETPEDQTESSTPDNPQERDTVTTEGSKSVTDEPGKVDMSKAEDEVIVIGVVKKRIPTILSSCVFCDKIFTTKGSLLAHKSKHLNNFKSKSATGETLRCDLCPKIFLTEGALVKHVQGHDWGFLQRHELEPTVPSGGDLEVDEISLVNET